MLAAHLTRPALRAGRVSRLVVALAVAPVLVDACTRADSGRAPSPTLDAVRTATEKYKDVNTALADGYVRDITDACETPSHMGLTQDLGVMGIHFLRRDLLGIDEDSTRLDVTGTHTDFLQPAVLLYEPQENGTLELVALENLVSAAVWEAEGHRSAPTFQGVAYHYRRDDPGMLTKAQYDLHVWLFKDNPKGMFVPYNPNATCKHHVYNMPMIHPVDPLPGQDHTKRPH